MASLSALAQGFISMNWFGGGDPTVGIKIGSPSNPSSQLPGWFVSGDYSVEAYMASGTGVAESSLTPASNTKTTFIGGATSSASGSPATDGSGLFQAGAQDTGLPLGADTIQIRAWYDPNHNTSYEQALAAGLNTGKSAVLSINGVTSTDPTIQSLDDIHMAAFTVSASVVPEPSTFALAGLGAAAMLIFRRRK